MNQTIQQRNKALVIEAFDTLFNKRDYEAAERYWSPNSYERCQVSFGRFIVDQIRWYMGCWQAFLTAPLTRRESEAMGVRSEKSAGCLNVGLWNVSTSKDWAYGSASASKLLSVHPSSDRSDNLTYSSA